LALSPFIFFENSDRSVRAFFRPGLAMSIATAMKYGWFGSAVSSLAALALPVKYAEVGAPSLNCAARSNRSPASSRPIPITAPWASRVNAPSAPRTASMFGALSGAIAPIMSSSFFIAPATPMSIIGASIGMLKTAYASLPSATARPLGPISCSKALPPPALPAKLVTSDCLSLRAANPSPRFLTNRSLPSSCTGLTPSPGLPPRPLTNPE